MMKMVAKSQPGLNTPRHDRWNPKDSNPSSRGLARNQINPVRFLSGEAKCFAHDRAPINQKATPRDQRWQTLEHSTFFPRTGLPDFSENNVLNSFDLGDVEMIDHPGVKSNLGRA